MTGRGIATLEHHNLCLRTKIQGRTYANLFGLVERFINAKVLELSQQYFFGDQIALEGLVRFSDEELKHQELFRRVELLAARGMPEGYSFAHDPNEVARVVLRKSSWAVLALTCHIELFTQAHYKKSIELDPSLSPLWKDVFAFHWKEESQHAVLDELEWRRVDGGLSLAQRDTAVDDAAVTLTPDQVTTLRASLLEAYRFQYLFSGLEMTRFPAILFGMVDAPQRARIEAALAALVRSIASPAAS